MFQFLKNKLLLGVVAGVLAVGMTIADADAKRVGGGRSIGKQSNTVTQRQQTPQQPTQAAPGAAPQQAAPAAAGAGAAGAAAAKPANRWLGPIAGLAAGLGIAALLSHFGMGGAFASMMANVIIIALIAFAAMWLIRRFRGNKSQSQTPAYAGAGNDASNNTLRQSWDSQQQPSSQPAPLAQPSLSAVPAATAGAATAAVAAPFGVPAGFDVEGFLRSAKVYFNRLQAAWDKGDQADINEFTTPQMFAEIKMDLEERGKSTNRTDVVQLDAELLGIEQTAAEYMASVRFSGLIREAEGAAAEPFNEVWNLTKPVAGSGGWVLAGIQQL
ncbi:Tim44 domain-containing protein [Pandoraea communis]|uniref:Membrane protein n=1 Tax=Pandoraea communis TaxID=2508297 RepID=A0A5E4R9C1_9BURK|nr:TIM44-like domain-containing protein [Pandoraea communis]MDM8355918.1 TIM44-like domain-containing protein [Pandoraea communis]VVD59956.1 membrane protein [Pandoraea communis]